jgi:hypothetical protein
MKRKIVLRRFMAAALGRTLAQHGNSEEVTPVVEQAICAHA